MELWDKLLSTLSDKLFQVTFDEEVLKEIGSAMREYRKILEESDAQIDLYVPYGYRAKWEKLYDKLHQRTLSWSQRIGLTKTEIHGVVRDFLDAYMDIVPKVRLHNERVATACAAKAAELVQPVEGRQLDEQQMRCITTEAHNHLVVAGAGTGKTTTILGYVKYLLKKGECASEDVLLLSFTNASAAEMSQRLLKELGVPFTAWTFHKLGLEIITAVQGKRPSIYSEDIRRFVRRELDRLIQEPAYLRNLNEYMLFGGVRQSEFDFQTEEEYVSYLQYNPPTTLKGEIVKSYGELDIANFLAQNRITYVYEAQYPVDTATSEYGQYHPDFYLPNFDVYIEYFGINQAGGVPRFFSGKNGMTAAQTYQAGMEWKRNLHRKNKTRLVEVYAYEKMEGTLIEALSQKLQAVGVTLDPAEPQVLWQQISGTEKQKLDRISELFGTVITLTKSNNYTIEDVRRHNYRGVGMHATNLVLNLVEPLYNRYQAFLRESKQIDFNDMINQATDYVQSGQYQHHFRHVIIDEYQDISKARFRLVQALRQQKDYRLFCVGDDWQSIYRFSGSDVGYILDFENFWGPAEISRIETTYRFPESLIEVSSRFIQKNPRQLRKQLQSAVQDTGFAMENISAYNEDYMLKFLAGRMMELPKDSTMLFLGRYRFDVKVLDKSKEFSYKYDATAGVTRVFFERRPDLKIRFMTIHGSKGLQADFVVLMNNRASGMGFPSHISNEPVLNLLLEDTDDYLFAEERRLFYVAITRARKKVFLLTLKRDESVFVGEVKESHGAAMFREQYSCPICGAKLVRRQGPHGQFYGCSNFSKTGCRYIRNIVKADAHPINEQ